MSTPAAETEKVMDNPHVSYVLNSTPLSLCQLGRLKSWVVKPKTEIIMNYLE